MPRVRLMTDQEQYHMVQGQEQECRFGAIAKTKMKPCITKNVDLPTSSAPLKLRPNDTLQIYYYY